MAGSHAASTRFALFPFRPEANNLHHRPDGIRASGRTIVVRDSGAAQFVAHSPEGIQRIPGFPEVGIQVECASVGVASVGYIACLLQKKSQRIESFWCRSSRGVFNQSPDHLWTML